MMDRMRNKARNEGLLWAHWLDLQTRQSNKTVLINAASDTSWSVQALTDASLPFFEHLRRYAPGERIAFRLPNGPDWFALFLALQRTGLAAIPLDGGTPTEGCLDIASRLGASALYLNGDFQSLQPPHRKDKTTCCIKVTSGSDGLPKGIECRSEHLIADGQNVARTMGIRRVDLNLAAIPLGHSYGLGNLVMPLLLQGTAMVVAKEYLPRQLIDWIGRYRVTIFPGVPALFRVLGALPPGPEEMKSLRTVISAGAILSPAVAKVFFERFGLKIHNFYGSSETGGICYDRTGHASLTGRSVGKPLAGVSVTVKMGRVTVKSAAVATPTGSWRLNDKGEWNGRAELVLLGRIGEGANIGGKKVHPLEIERALRALPKVTDATVWSWHSQGRDLLAAAVETTQSRAQIEHALARHLPAWKLPKVYLVARELPRNSRGKLDLPSLRQRIQGKGTS
jgi:acyl-coenzyme A synthetase/AMP-(fatty) acid ligase